MKIEKLKALGKRNGSMMHALRQLEPGQCLRVSTAREGRTASGLSSIFAREGKVLRTRMDGDDVLIWLEHKAKNSAS